MISKKGELHMDNNAWLTLGLLVLGVVALIGFFCTKAKGFGQYATSTLLLILVLIMSTLLFAANKLTSESLLNIFFAIIGFAGGLFTSKDSNSRQENK